jgi:MFS family permease
LFTPYAGVIAERRERVTLMVSLDVISATVMLLLALVVTMNGSVVVVICLGACAFLCLGVYEPALNALLPSLVPEAELGSANSLRGLIDNLAVVLGPAGAATLLLFGGPATPLLVAGAAFAASALIVARVKTRTRPVDVTEAGTVGPLRQMLVGIRTITSSTTASVLVAFSVLASFVYGTDTVLFVLVSKEVLATGSGGYGYLLTGLGLGGILAVGLSNRLSSRPRLAYIIWGGFAAYTVPTAAYLVVDDPMVGFVLQVVRGAGTMVVDVVAITALQRSLPEDVLARVFGAYLSLVIAAIAIGAVTVPPLVEGLGLDPTLLIVGILLPSLAAVTLPWLKRADTIRAAT